MTCNRYIYDFLKEYARNNKLDDFCFDCNKIENQKRYQKVILHFNDFLDREMKDSMNIVMSSQLDDLIKDLK
jgi:hypothetical protein